MIYSGFLLFNAILNFLLGIFVLSRKVQETTKKTFCYWLFSMSIWHIMDFGLSIAPNEEFAIKWAKITFAGVSFIPSTFYHFVTSFLKERGKRRYYLIPIGYIISILFISISLSGLLISGVVSLKIGGYFPQFAKNVFPSLFLLFFYAWTLAGVFLLLRRFLRTRSGLEKNQLKYVLVGLIIAIAGGITNFILAFSGKERVFPIGNLAEVFFIGLTALSIVKYRLMDIDVFIRPTIVYAILTGLIIASWLTSIFIFDSIFPFETAISRLLGLFIAIFLFSILKEKVQFYVDKLFYREKQQLQEAAEKIATHITSTIDPDIITTSSMNEIYNTIHPQSIYLMLLNKDRLFYDIKALLGDKEAPFPLITSNSPLVEWLKVNKRAILKDEVENETKRDAIKVNNEMEKGGMALVAPLFIENEIIGLLCLKDKKTGWYTLSEIGFLETIAKELAISLDNTMLYAELKKKKEELEKALKVKADFLHVVSHELNTPLTIIMSNVYFLEKWVKEKNLDFSSAIETIKRRGHALSLLIKDIMDVASEEKYEPKAQRINVNRLIEEAISSFKVMAFNKELDIILEIPKKIFIVSDRKLLENILFRLIDNAVKFTPAGGSITIGVEKMPSEVLFFVKDTGIGIKDSFKEKIFERFFQVDSSSTREYGGIGLGLNIVKNIVAALGGKIWVESKPGKGSKFCFTLPNSESGQ